ncbi:MAG: helix-turn-helix domain-containing protein [Firmicutes bacterium]|nr:helix-turn-helix domain-containing protein [Bacillota bacterium]
MAEQGSNSFSNSLISNTIFHLLNFERYPGFQTALREAAVNNDFQVIVFSEQFNRVLSIETRYDSSAEEVLLARIEQNIKDNTKSVIEGYEQFVTFWRTMMLGGKKYTMLLVDNNGNFSEDDLCKLSEIIELAMGMWNYVPERDVVSEFIGALRRGNRSLAAILLDELAMKEDEFYGVFMLKGADKEVCHRLILEFEHRCHITCLLQSDNNCVTGVILRAGRNTCVSPEIWADFMAKLKESGLALAFNYLGINSIDGLCNGFRMINETEHIVPQIFTAKKSFSKYEMAIASNCTNICLNGGVLKNSYQQLLKPLSDSEGLKSTQLMDTLETFVLDAGCSIVETAKLMNIHANTVQYRLKHIREELNVDISDSSVVLGLTIALAIRRIDKEVRSI